MNTTAPGYAFCVVYAAHANGDHGGPPPSQCEPVSLESVVHRVRWPLTRTCVRADEG